MNDLIKKSPYADVDLDDAQKEEFSSDTASAYAQFRPRKIKVGDILDSIYSNNLAFSIEEDRLDEIGKRVKADYEADLNSNTDKFERIEKAEKLANLESVREPSEDDWENCADTVHPQIAETLNNYWSRMLKEFVKDGQVVKYKINGDDKEGKKAERAQRRGEYLSYYLLNKVDGFLKIVSNTFLQQGCNGKAFLTAHNDYVERELVVDGIFTTNLVADAHMKSINKGNRYTHQYYLYGHDIDEKVRTGEFCNFVYGEGVAKTADSGSSDSVSNGSSSASLSSDGSYLMLQQRCRIDLDRDGYKEPYIVIVCHETGCVARIFAAYDEKTVFVRVDRKKDKKSKKLHIDYELVPLAKYIGVKESIPEESEESQRIEKRQKIDENTEVFVAKVEPRKQVVEIPFLQNVKGGFYGLGLGEIMVETVRMINSLANETIDSAECSNFRTGFYNKNRVRIAGYEGKSTINTPRSGFLAAEYDGESFASEFHELQRHEPSPVIPAMRAELIGELEKLDGSTGLNSGQMPRGNAPVGTVVALLAEGQNKYEAVMTMTCIGFKEFYQLVDDLLIELKPDDLSYHDSEGNWKTLEDGDLDDDGMLDIEPVADPNNVTNILKLMKADLLLNAMGPITSVGGNASEIVRLYLEAINICKPERILPADAQPPMNPAMLDYQLQSDKLNLEVMKVAHEYEIQFNELGLKIQETRAKIKQIYADAQNKLADAEAKNPGIQYAQAMADLEASQKELEIMTQQQKQANRYIQQLNSMIERKSQNGPVRQGSGPGAGGASGMVQEQGNEMAGAASQAVNSQQTA